MSESTSKPKVKKPVDPPRQKMGHQHKRGKKSKKPQEKPPVLSTESQTEPSAPPMDEVIETMIFEPSAPLLDLLEPPTPTKKVRAKINKEMMKTLKKEDEKYPNINFDVPPRDWSKEDQSKMRDIIRTMSLTYKKDWDRKRVHQIGHQVRNSGPVEMALARDIIGLLQKDINLMSNMKLQHVAFSTFSRKTYDWEKVSELLDHKFTPAECEEFWYMELYPRIKNMGFSPANDKQLMELAIANRFKNWKDIAENIMGHTEYQCYVHFRRNLCKTILDSNSE